MPPAILPHDHHSAMEQTFDHMPDSEAFAATADLFKLLSGSCATVRSAS